MLSFPIPPQATRIQKLIIIEYSRLRSVPKVAEEMGYKSPSFVRSVVHEYKDFLASNEAVEAHA